MIDVYFSIFVYYISFSYLYPILCNIKFSQRLKHAENKRSKSNAPS
jgi:hypothetical protein